MSERTRICSTCHTRPCRVTVSKRGARRQQGTCAECHKAYMIEWRRGQRVLHGTFPRGTIARIAKAQRRLGNSGVPPDTSRGRPARSEAFK